MSRNETGKRQRSAMVTVDDFKNDPMFARTERAVAAILVNGKVVAPVDVLVRMDVLTPQGSRGLSGGVKTARSARWVMAAPEKVCFDPPA